MSGKAKSAKVNRHYFAETRDYNKVVDAERAFFSGLLEARDHIPNHSTIQKALSDVTGFLQDRGKTLDVLVEFPVTDPRTKVMQTMMLGTRLQPPLPGSHALATHFLCLADTESLLTKFHADFDFHPEAKEKKPSPHVQLGGRIFPSLVKNHPNKNPKVWWNEDMDKPRMPALPICTALLWHWAFLEYQDSDKIGGFLKAWHWHDLVKKAETAVLKPFFDDGSRLLERHPDKGALNTLYFPVSK